MFLNETFRKASSLICTENEGLVDKHGCHLMPAMPILQKHRFFEKGPKIQQFWKNYKTFFGFPVTFLIGLFNGPSFVFIMSTIGGTQKLTFLPSHLNWPPLYLSSATVDPPISRSPPSCLASLSDVMSIRVKCVRNFLGQVIPRHPVNPLNCIT